MPDLNARAAKRTKKIYELMQSQNYRRTDRLFSYLMLAQWLFAVGCALVLSPSTYAGAVSSIHPHVWAAIALGALLTLLPCSFIYLRPGATITRHVVAVNQILMSALLIHLTGGRIETHFHIFGSLAFLAFYCDWKVLVTAAGVAAADHFLRGIYWPASVFGTDVVNHYKWLEHAGWVVFEISFLIPGVIKVQEQMQSICARRVDLEMMNEKIEKEVKLRTEELSQTQAQLVQSQKLEAIGQLASGVAHDFNNMLGGILAYASLLKADYSHDIMLSSGLGVIESSAERGAELTKKLLAFARKGNYEHTTIDIKRTIDETVALLAPSLNGRVEITTDFAEDIWPTEGDSTQVFQVIMNLAVNAKDAMPEGGKIKISAKNIEADEAYCALHKSAQPGQYLRVSIEDTGTGIPLELQAKIFEPFFTTKQPGSGTGLGLAMVYGIMKSHKGFVGVYSEVGVGTVFHLYFPKAGNAGSAITLPSQSAGLEENALNGCDILLADDEDIMRRAGCDILRRYGAKVHPCADGAEALEELKANPAKYKIVILDVIMPRLNGIDAFHQMRQVAPEAYYIFSSGYAESSEITELRNRFPVAFIQKPYRAEKLFREITKKAA